MQSYLFLLYVLGVHVYSLPVITDPCGGGRKIENPSPQIKTSGQPVRKGSVHDAALEASILARILEEKYNNPNDPHIRISDSMKTLLDGKVLENFPVESKDHGDKLLSTKLQHHYDNVSIIAVFADVVYNDELQSARINNFKSEMQDFNFAVARLLCKVHLYAVSKKVEIGKNIGQDVMSKMYRNMKNAPARDFVIYRDAKKYLKDMSEEYN